MRITENDWIELESEQHHGGAVVRRLQPHSGHDVFLAVQQPSGRRMLVLRVPRSAAEFIVRQHRALPATRGMSMEFVTADSGHRDLQIMLTAGDRREVFNPLISDIAGTAEQTSGPEELLRSAIQRFHHWQQLLRSIADGGMSEEKRRGLYGELIVLRDLLLPVLPPHDALEAWTGPSGTNQDFQLARAAVEVKTSAAKATTSVVIASERQLDDTGVEDLLLVHLAVDERQGGTGESLNAVVDSIRNGLPGAEQIFDDLLTSAGYLREQRDLYEEPRYTRRSLDFWRVGDEFPRITASELRPGVSDCTYRISTVGLDGYRVSADEVSRIAEGRP